MVEGLAHDRVSMLTLTYAPRHLPEGASLVPADVAGFLKRLRLNFERGCARDPALSGLSASELALVTRLRFFVVGEYGGKFGRPHYHVICYGADRSTFVNGVPFAQVVRAAWGKGSTHVGGSWSVETAAYVSAYVVKGHNVKGHWALAGRHPEFSRWPNGKAGGLGVPGLDALFPSADGLTWSAAFGDRLPRSVSIGGVDRVLGGFLLDRLRRKAGLGPLALSALKRRLSRERVKRERDIFLDALLRDSLAHGDVGVEDAVMSLMERS